MQRFSLYEGDRPQDENRKGICVSPRMRGTIFKDCETVCRTFISRSEKEKISRAGPERGVWRGFWFSMRFGRRSSVRASIRTLVRTSIRIGSEAPASLRAALPVSGRGGPCGSESGQYPGAGSAGDVPLPWQCRERPQRSCCRQACSGS